jgi:hypothetical protein
MSKKVKKWQKVFRQESCRTVSGWPDDIDKFFAALENGLPLRKPTREKNAPKDYYDHRSLMNM